MKIQELGAFYQRQLSNVEKLATTDNLWHSEAVALLAEELPAETDARMEYLHQLQRLHRIAVAGLADNQEFHAAVTAQPIPSWQNYTAPPVSLDLQHSLAAKLYNVKPGEDKCVIVNIGDGSREIGKWIIDKLRNNGFLYQIYFIDPDFTAFVFNHTTEEGVKALAADYVDANKPATKVIASRPGQPQQRLAIADPDKENLYGDEIRSFGQRISSGELFYTLTEIPTPKDAELDGIPYEKYIRLFFEMIDQPIAEIDVAQRGLIAEFNAASMIRFTNSDGTDLSMSLIDHDGSHFTFCNSLIAKNVPGTEFFSAPRRDSVEGTIVAKGRFEVNDHIIENLTMRFSQGYLKEFSAEKGQEHFEDALKVEGARYVGEIGIGTNPHLKQHLVNGLLVEKIGGSFHVALGRAYKFTTYAGQPVKTNNGNESSLHWDVTTMLYGKEGCIYLDGRLVMKDGLWLDPKYDVLNRGWAAIPKERRPAYWQDYTGPALVA